MTDFSVVISYFPYLLRGALTTIQIAFFSSIIGFVLGTILGFLHRSKNSLITSIIDVYVTLFRGTPMLIQISFAFYLLPAIGIDVPAFTAAIIAIGLNSSAYISQIIRSGIGSVGSGQIEAAHVLGLSHFQTLRFIVFPQAIRIVLPALLNEFITLIKDSSLASTIGVVELFKEGSIIISRTYNAIPIYLAVAFIYLILTSTLSIIMGYINRKLHGHVVN